MTLDEIATLARAYVSAREALESVAYDIKRERRRVVRRRLRALKARAAEASAAKDALRAAIEAVPALFARPRTRALEGVKVGYRKMPGRFEIEDEARTVERVRVRLPGREDALIRVKEAIDRAALKHLKARELAQIGVALVEPDDEVVIATAPSDLDKLVDALLADDDLEEAA